MKGRKPKPTLLKLAGGRVHSRLNEHEPKGAVVDPTLPAELTDPIEQREWQRIVAALTPGHVLETDRASLLAYVRIYARWCGATAEAATVPMLTQRSDGGTMLHPAHKYANHTLLLMLRVAAELGFTPSSRSRISAVPPPSGGDHDFDLFQRQRPRRP